MAKNKYTSLKLHFWHQNMVKVLGFNKFSQFIGLKYNILTKTAFF